MSQPPGPRYAGDGEDSPTAELPAYLSPRIDRPDDDHVPERPHRPVSPNRGPWLVTGAIVLIAVVAAALVVLLTTGGGTGQTSANGQGNSSQASSPADNSSSDPSDTASSEKSGSEVGLPNPSSSSGKPDLSTASDRAQTFLDLLSDGSTGHKDASKLVCPKERSAFQKDVKSGKYDKLEGKDITAESASPSGGSSAKVQYHYSGGSGSLTMSQIGGQWYVCQGG